MKHVVLFLLAFLCIPLGTGFLLTAIGIDASWDVAKIAQYFVIFYYNGLANGERQQRKSMSTIKLPPLIKMLLFPFLPNKFTKSTVLYQGTLIVITILALFFILILRTDAHVVFGSYILLGFLDIVITKIYRKIC